MYSLLDNLIERYPNLSYLKQDILTIYEILKDYFESDSTLFLCGNGGSASDCEHIAGEMLKSFEVSRVVDDSFKEELEKKYGKDGSSIAAGLQKGFKTISLTSHPAFSTAFENDVDPSLVFAQQLFVLGSKNDILLALSTSGNSENIYRCIQTASAMGVKTILMTGENGGRCAEVADISLKVPADRPYLVQELHQPIYHTLCLMLEKNFYG